MKCLLKEKARESLLAGVLLIVVVAVLVFAVMRSRQGGIASVDMERIINAHPAMQEAITTFQKEISDRQTELNKMKGEEKVKEQQKLQQEISQIAMRLQQEAMDKIKKDIEQVAREKGYTFVIENNAIIVGGRDITEDVLAVLRQRTQKAAEQKKTDVSDMPMIPVK